MKANTFREKGTLFAGRRGDQCIIFRDQGAQIPLGASIVMTYRNRALFRLELG